jgi:hypothetical protein
MSSSEAVALWDTGNRLQTEVAAELGIMPTMLRRWQRKLQEGSVPLAGPAAKPPASYPCAGGTPVLAVYTNSRHYLPMAPNLLAQRFVATAQNRIWIADITYIATGEGWLYRILRSPNQRSKIWRECPRLNLLEDRLGEDLAQCGRLERRRHPAVSSASPMG